MARKIPPPVLHHASQNVNHLDQAPEGRSPEHRTQRTRRFSNSSNRTVDTVCDLPSSSANSTPSRRSSPGETGTRPRAQSMSGAPTRPFVIRRSPPQSASPSPTPTEVRSRRRRLDSLHLDPPRHTDNCSDNDHFFHFGQSNMPSTYEQDTMVQGEELYLHFFHERLRNEGLREVAEREEARLESYHTATTHINQTRELEEVELSSSTTNRRTRTLSLNLENFQDPIWRQTGRDLQLLADQFARSHERLLVRQRAEEVDISTLTKDKFIDMLIELFKGGHVTRERILVLFFFCSDVAIFAIRSGAGRLLAALTEWSLIFIKDQVCSWVQNNGGWREVLHSGLNMVQQTMLIGSCAMIIFCCAIYIKKNLRSFS